MTLRDFIRFTIAFCVVTFGDGVAAGFLHRAPASFVAVVTVALLFTVLAAVREGRV